MSTAVRILYWKEIPVQVQANDGSDTVSRLLDDRFQGAVDSIAMLEGSIATDEYLDAWAWSHYEYSDEPAGMAADAVAAKFNYGMPDDFVARLRDATKDGSRNPIPGGINDWLAD